MEQHIISDLDLFNIAFNTFLEENNQVKVMALIKQKHVTEMEEDKVLEDKRIDLFIWQAFLFKQLIKNKVIKKSIENKYNHYYNKIKESKSLKDLQALELVMFNTYLNFMIYDVEVTKSHALNRILRCIHMNLDNTLNLDEIAKQTELSKSYVSQIFKKEMNMSVMTYVNRKKMDRAKMYLSTTNMSIMEISQILGFYDSSHFSRIFKEFEKVSPKIYRQQL